MADDNIQRSPGSALPASNPAGGERITTSPLPASVAGRAPDAPAGSAIAARLAYGLKYLAIVLAFGLGCALLLNLVFNIETRKVVGFTVIAVVVGGGIARAALGRGPAQPRTGTAAPPEAHSEVSNTREVVETVVFVVVLVLLLKSFVAEAFVIPTGSMATTLYGYQKEVKCPKCGYLFPVNCSQEVEPQEGGRPIPITGCTCPNCRYPISLMTKVEERDQHSMQRREVEVPDTAKWPPHTGDRVLVGKFLYDLPWNSPEKHRLNVVVFKYPKEPQKAYTPMNYIKRLIGLPGETIGIYYGKLYILSPDKGLHYDDSNVPELDRWKYPNMHVDDTRARERWTKGEFEILRKPPEIVIAESRIVYDNDHPASDLLNLPRWQDRSGASAWTEDASAHTFRHAASTVGPLAWLRYRHLLRDHTQPELITDFMGYNSYTTLFQPEPQQPQHWAGDLMVEADVTIDKPEGQVVFELSRGSQRFRAAFDLASGDCTLRQIKDWSDRAHKGAPPDDAGEVLATKPTELKKPGKFHVRFANVDDRLLLWVDRALPFGDGVAYTAAKDRGPEAVNDLEPASIGVSGAGVTVGKLQLWRDTYYTQMRDAGLEGREDVYPSGVEFGDPSTWDRLHDLSVRTYYVQPGCYMCMGDNSPHSSDGRAWGLVPERLMLGRALVVYYPFDITHGWPGEQRIGPIH
jgi:signal peptidase I